LIISLFWKQYHDGGQIVHIYEVNKESRPEDFVELSDNPFDQGKTIVGLGNKKPKDRSQKERQKLLERIEKEKDSDIRAELKKGNVVIEIIQDGLNY
jgi:hypothetical protein